MNKVERAQRNVWRDEAIKAVEQARTEEAFRSQDQRSKIAKRQFLLLRVRELLNFGFLIGDEIKTKELWINRKIVGKTPAQNPDAPRIAPRYEAWPAEGESPEWLRKRFADEHWLWNALALPLQHTISRIREQQNEAVAAVYKEAEDNGLKTKDEQVRKKLGPKIKAALKDIDFSPLKRIEEARSTVLEEADSIRSGKIMDSDAEMLRFGWNRANWAFALAVSKLPAWLQRIVEKRVHAASKARRTKRAARASEKWFRGYPKADPEDRSGEGRLDVYFNGDNVAWCSAAMKNGYVDISVPCNPADHHGPRKGKYRSLREMREVTIYEPGASARTRTKREDKNRFTLNVLFHSVPAGAWMKEYKLRAKKDANGKLRWFFIPTFELPGESGVKQRVFGGVDVGWRKAGEEQFAIAHSWDEVRGCCHWLGRISDNRWAKRYNRRQEALLDGERFPVRLTPEGVREFASRKGALQQDFKMSMGEILEKQDLRPPNWDRIGRRGIARMMTDEKSPEFAALQRLRPDYDVWARRDIELARIHRVAWGMVSENLERQRREIARKILSGVTDVGVEALDVRQMAQAENEGTTNWERHIENIRDRSRQLTGPAKFLSILVNTARKMGKRVHEVDPYHTSKSCSDCGHINDIGAEQTFTCAGCGRLWNRDENAARTLARLARECAGGDAHPLKCSRDGNSVPFHGLPRPAYNRSGEKAGENGKVLANKSPADSKQGSYRDVVTFD